MAVPRGPWGSRRNDLADPPEGDPVSEPGDDGLSEPPGEEAVSQYPCGACGAVLSYRPGERVLHCAFCGAETPIPQGDPAALAEAVRERCYSTALADSAGGAETETTQVAHCDACGAHVEFDPGTHARECPFCATPLVADTTPDRHIRPQGLLPFAIGAAEARQALAQWLRSRWFAPGDLKRFARAESRLSGIYTPYWTFDARTETAYRGHRGDGFTVMVRGPKGRPVAQRRMRWRPVSGRVQRAFDDVLVVASQSLPRDHVDALAPWDLSQLKPYARDWLAGFRAEAYTVPLETGFANARGQMDVVIRADVARAIGGEQQRITAIDTRIAGVTFKHILLPVWVAAYRFRGRVWRVVINGRTGSVRGERPWSLWKIGGAVLLAVLLLAMVFFLAEGGRLP